MKTIIFIVEKISQPRCVKRIQSIIDMGYPYKVYGFEDGSYNSDLSCFPFTITEVLSQPRCVSYLDKIRANLYPYVKFFEIIRKNRKNTVFYIFGYELAKVFYLLGCRNYIYEEADINSAKIANNLRRRIAIKLDKTIALKSLLTVYTSKGFVEYLFGDRLKKPKFLIVPNKLSNFFDDEKRRCFIKTKGNKLRFGFIGLIRYPQTIFRFASIIAAKYPQYEFHLWGGLSGGLIIPEDLNNSNNVFFHGPFANPDDLEHIYSQIDVNIACYDTKSVKYAINVRVAEPNKLYESIYFGVPIIVSSNTYVGKRVLELGVGTAIDCSNDEEIVNFIESLNQEMLNGYCNNAKEIPTNKLVYNPEKLLSFLNKIMQ